MQPGTPLSDPTPSPRRRLPKQARALETRARIVAAALTCFEQEGYDGTTTVGIASRAGIAVGTVYAYFANKREILLEIIEGTVAETSSKVVEGLDPGRWHGADPRAITRSLIDLIFHTQSLRPGMQRVAWERYFKDPDVRERIEAIWSRTREAIGAFLDALERDGQLRPLDRESATHVIHNAVQWNASRAFAQADPATIDARARTTADMISRFVFCDSNQG